jgi:NTE family protein
MTVPTMAAAGPVGAGAAHAIAFGGGGEWFVAWMVGYAQGLLQGGVDLAKADVTIGTSAGAMVGAAIKGGRLAEFADVLTKLGDNPAAADKELNISSGAPSQARARTVMGNTDALTPTTLQQIGRAAMASRNAPDDEYVASVQGLLGLQDWPTGHHTTATDCYTGESLIASSASGVSISQAAAASSSLPGVNGPTWLGDRLCMDGGVSDSSTHAKMLQGASFVLIIGMFDFQANPPQHVNPSFGIAERVNPGTAQREAAFLRANGSTVHVTIANPDPSTDFMDAATIAPAMADGEARGTADAAAIRALWINP